MSNSAMVDLLIHALALHWVEQISAGHINKTKQHTHTQNKY